MLMSNVEFDGIGHKTGLKFKLSMLHSLHCKLFVKIRLRFNVTSQCYVYVILVTLIMLILRMRFKWLDIYKLKFIQFRQHPYSAYF